MTRPEHLGPLLDVWREPAIAVRLSMTQWDRLVRTARTAKLLASLASRLEHANCLGALPDAVQGALRGEERTAAFLEHMARFALRRLAATLAPLQVDVVLLKGAAYLAQDLALSRGRLVSDVDILVPAARLAEVEDALTRAGWVSKATDPYDDRYYRAWGHELPPLRHADHPLELDVHHQILPPTGRIHPRVDALFAAAVPLAGQPFKVLCPADQVLHACAHAFQDSDCTNRLRDLADIDFLVRHHGTNDAFWSDLLRRAALHGMGRPLWYGVRQARDHFATPMPEHIQTQLSAHAPTRLVEMLMSAALARTLAPVNPDRLPNFAERASRLMLGARYHFLRMPPFLLARHALSKLVRTAAHDWKNRRASDAPARNEPVNQQ